LKKKITIEKKKKAIILKENDAIMPFNLYNCFFHFYINIILIEVLNY